MIDITGALIELQTDVPERLAEFYERLAGLERAATSPQDVTVRGRGLTLRIRRGPAREDVPGGPVFGFVLAEGGDLSAVREHAVGCGAVVLTETKREGSQSITCADPAGYEFTLALPAPALAAPSAEAGATGPTEIAVRAAPNGTPAPPTSAPDRRRVTRRDIDRLQDMQRLAQMQETIAGLHEAFTPDDPAAALDAMRAKLGPAAETLRSEREEALARARAEERRVEAESLLERYKRQLVSDPDPEPQSRPLPAGPLDREESFELDLPKRTLGGAPDADDKE